MHPTQSKSIVLLDDEKSYVDLLSTMLAERFARPIHTYYRPLEALAALPDLNPGIVITDYYMPQLNGFEFISQAASLVPGVPFVMITGNAVGLAIDQIPGVNPLKSILAKPFGWRRLSDEILAHWPEAGVSESAAPFVPTSE